MRFQAYFAPVIKVLLYIMAVISIIGLTIGILALAGVRIELTTPQATLLVSVWRLYVGFIDIFGGKVALNKILNIVFDNGKMYISYLAEQGVDPIIAAIVISPKRYNEMKDLLMSKNPNIVFYDSKNDSTDSQQ